MKHYRLVFEEVKDVEDGGFMTAAIKSCSGCKRLISGMGGGGAYMCESCRGNILRGYLYPSFLQAAKDLEDSITKP